LAIAIELAQFDVSASTDAAYIVGYCVVYWIAVQVAEIDAATPIDVVGCEDHVIVVDCILCIPITAISDGIDPISFILLQTDIAITSTSTSTTRCQSSIPLITPEIPMILTPGIRIIVVIIIITHLDLSVPIASKVVVIPPRR